MKAKAYITPESTIETMAGEQLICASVTGIDGDTGIEMGEGDTPTEADSRGSKSVWDDDDEW
jgi:hypothetical protein